MLLQAFVQKLAVCLLDVDRNPLSPMVDHINAWAAEATCCVSFLLNLLSIVCIALGHALLFAHLCMLNVKTA